MVQHASFLARAIQRYFLGTTSGVGWPGRLARKPGLRGHRRSRNSDPKGDIGVMKHGPGVRKISLGCAARASLVNTINSCTYKTIKQVFCPTKAKITIVNNCSLLLLELRFGTPFIAYRDYSYRYIGRSGFRLIKKRISNKILIATDSVYL